VGKSKQKETETLIRRFLW